MEIDDVEFADGGKYHEAWLNLTRMILEWEDGHDSASNFAKKLIAYFADLKAS